MVSHQKQAKTYGQPFRLSYNILILLQFNFSCVAKTRCNDNRDAEGITVFNSGSVDLSTLINAAQNAECPGVGEICCAERFTDNGSSSNNLYSFWTIFCCGCLVKLLNFY